MMDEAMERIRRWFGVYEKDDRFDEAVSLLLRVYPEETARDIIGKIWSTALDRVDG